MPEPLYASINPEMLILAREAAGLTQTELADRLGIAQGKVSRIEAQLSHIDNEFLQRLCAELGRTPAFFSRPGRRHSGAGVTEMYHRKRESMPKRVLARLHAIIDTIRIHFDEILKAIELESDYVFPHYDIDDPLEDRTPVGIAQELRAIWRIPPGPVNNLTQVIEGAGGLIFVMDFETSLLDAICRWYPGLPPLFFLNSRMPGDRYRYTLAHELGHMVMHNRPNPNMEAQADQFAAEFLMPAADIRSSLTNVTLPRLAHLKPYWKVSMAALLKRATDLMKVSENQARYLWSRFSSLGYRRSEPMELEIPVEQPQLVNSIIETCQTALGWTTADFEQHLMTSDTHLRPIYFRDQPGLRMVR